jgi:hypothetical protein
VFVLNNSGKTGVFTVPLTPGTYQLRAAFGDATTVQRQNVQLWDGDKLIANVASDHATSAGTFLDATGVPRSAAAWPAANAPRTVTVNSGALHVRMGLAASGLAASTIATLQVIPTTSPGPPPPPPPPPPVGTPTFETATAYTQTRPDFTPLREIDVTSSAALRNAILGLRAGDYVKATSAFTVDGQTVLGRALTGPAVLDLGGFVTFAYTGGQEVAAVYLHKAGNLRIYGGNVTTNKTGGYGILTHGSTNVTWWGFKVHDCGMDGLAAFTAKDGGPVTGCDFAGELTNNGLHWAYDPHSEKGSGLHGANLDDSGIYAFHGNRFALDIHDQPAGAAVEYGSQNIPPVSNTLILRARRLTFVSRTQTGGNALQIWGVNGQGLDIPYLEVEDAQGYGLWTGGMFGGATLGGVSVEYARAAHTNLNPRYAGQNPWDARHGVVYHDVQPPPVSGHT